MKIAVTGGMGSGKSTVSRILANYLDADLINSDELCREQLSQGTEAMAQLEQLFGNRFISADGSLDRIALRQSVFNDQSVKESLESILHPIVRKQVMDLCESQSIAHKSIVVEVPLLFEVGWQNDFDCSVVVRVNEQISVVRVVARDRSSEVDVKRVIGTQMPIGEKVSLADYTIDNSGTLASTMQQIGWLSRQLVDSRK